MPKSLKVIKLLIHIHIIKEKNVKHCMACPNTAGQQVCLYSSDGVTTIEKYCDEYAGKVAGSRGR
jgi:hypothetical protein